MKGVMIRMNIRIMYGRFKYKIKKWLEFNRIRKTLYAIKVLNLNKRSFFNLICRSDVICIVDLTNKESCSDSRLRRIAALKYIHNYQILFYNENYSEDCINYKKLINKYYLKLLNGGQNNG